MRNRRRKYVEVALLWSVLAILAAYSVCQYLRTL